MDKQQLFENGKELATRFCQKNGLFVPEIITIEKENRLWHIDACGWYRVNEITIKIPCCAHIGRAGRSWSYPGWVIDRTPYGVVAHEIGHHVDLHLSRNSKVNFSTDIRKQSGEERLTNYCPNSSEWFAEMFRLFVTNPDLLRILRPLTYNLLLIELDPVELRPWQKVLANAPERTRQLATRRVATA